MQIQGKSILVRVSGSSSYQGSELSVVNYIKFGGVSNYVLLPKAYHPRFERCVAIRDLETTDCSERYFFHYFRF